ncbi:MAG: hypothetical protein LC792_07130, partial [Actinobacteria bacterium]|nr:hypothetical protein [Actinomycetota bacterium]
MGPVRHQQLIRLLACLVALDLAVGVVAVYARGDRASSTGMSVSAGRVTGPSGSKGAGSNGILAGGQFLHRRGSGSIEQTPATGSAMTAAAPTSAGVGRSTSTATAAGLGSSSTSSTGPTPSSATSAPAGSPAGVQTSRPGTGPPTTSPIDAGATT